MATLKEITHDSGPPVSNHYTNVSDGAGRLSITVGAALNSSVYGLQIDFSSASDSRLDEPFVSPASEELRCRFYFDPNSPVAPTIGEEALVSVGLGNNAWFSAPTKIVAINLNTNSSGDIIARYSISTDGGGGGSAGSDIITDEPHCFEMVSVRATGVASNDGEYEFYIDGVLKASATNVDNFDLFPTIDFINVLASAQDASQSGTTTYLDEILVTDVAGTALCAATGLALASMTKPASINADGSFIYLALLEGGTPILTKIATDLLSDGTTVFNPGAGDNIGVQCGKFDANIVWIAGNFGGTDTVEKSENAGSSFTVKDPATFDPVTSFVVGPDSDDRVLVFTDAGGSVASSSIQETSDSGTSWDQKDSGLGFVSKAVERLDINVEEIVTGNEAGASDNIHYSPNTGEDLEDYSTGFPTQDVTKVIVG